MSHDHGASCACVAEHRPHPLEFERHHVWPVYLGGPKDGPTVWVCPTTHTNVHEVLRALLRNGRFGWGEARRRWPGLNRYAYSLALRAYDRHKEATS